MMSLRKSVHLPMHNKIREESNNKDREMKGNFEYLISIYKIDMIKSRQKF